MAKEDFNKGDIKNYDGNSVESLSFGTENSPLWHKLEERKKKWSETVAKLVFENLIKVIEKRLTYITDKGGDWLEITFDYYENPDAITENEVKIKLFSLINEWLARNIKSKEGAKRAKFGLETYMDDRWFWILNKVDDEYTTFDEIEEKFEEKKWNFEDYCRRTKRSSSYREWVLNEDVKMPEPDGWRYFLDKGEYRKAVLIINWGGSLLV